MPQLIFSLRGVSVPLNQRTLPPPPPRYRKEAEFYGGCGIVGAQIPLGAGLGLAHKMAKDGCIAITM